MKNSELQINKIAQGIISIQNGINWFDSFDLNEKKQILQSLSVILTQAHPTSEEIANGIEQSKLKATYTPCVFMLHKPFNEAIAKIRNLPECEWEKTFVLWLSIFSLADRRRRETECSGGCAHEWHDIRNL